MDGREGDGITQLNHHPEILSRHIAILGKTGAGKSYLARVIVEGILRAAGRVCVIDPTGVWWGLRSNAAGDGPGFPVLVFGGRHGDIRLAAGDGAALAEIIGTSSTPAVLDTSDLRVSERTRLFADFASGLVQQNRGPLHLVVDEAHLFAPQGRVADPLSAQMLHAANNLVSLGRARGLRITLITQRPAKLHKDSLTQVETLIALRLIAPQDRRAVEDWIADNADARTGRNVISSLATLRTGEGWIWAPEFGLLERIAVPRITTWDSGRAPEEDDDASPVLAPIDLAAIQARLETAAAEEADDPARLRRRVAELEAELRKAGRPAPAALDRARAEGVTVGAASARAELNRVAGDLAAIGERLAALQRSIGAALEEPSQLDGAPVATPPPPRPARSPAKPRLAPGAPAAASPLSGPQQQLLGALAWWAAAGHDAPSRAQVAAVTGWRVTSGHLKNVAGSLRSLGLVDYPAEGRLALSAAGRGVAPEAEAGAGLVDRIRAILDGPQRQVLEALLSAPSNELGRGELAARCGWSPASGHVKNVVGSMRSLELVTYPAAGRVALAGWVRD